MVPQLGLREQLQAKGGQVPKKVITAPFVQIPLGVTEDRLVGTVDIEASMKASCSCTLLLTDVLSARGNSTVAHCLWPNISALML